MAISIGCRCKSYFTFITRVEHDNEKQDNRLKTVTSGHPMLVGIIENLYLKKKC